MIISGTGLPFRNKIPPISSTMRKTLFTLVAALFAQLTFAQIVRTAVFDFTNPQALTPSITPASQLFDQVDVTEKVFQEEAVTLSFLRGENFKVGSKIMTGSQDGKVVYALTVARDTKAFVSVENDRLLSCYFYGSSVKGFSLESEGKYNVELDYSYWVDDKYKGDGSFDNAIHKLSLNVVSTSYPTIDSMVVTYLVKQDIFTPTSSVADGDVLDTFQDLVLTFPGKVKVNKDANFTLMGSDGKSYPLSVSSQENVVTLHCAELLYLSGNYQVVIPDMSFISEDGIYYNPELTYSFSVVEATNTLMLVESNPAANTNIDEFPAQFTLKFRKEVGGVKPTGNLIQIYDVNGNLKRSANLSLDDDDLYGIKAEFTRKVALTEAGEYILHIPEGIIFDMGFNDQDEDFGLSHGAKCNPEINLHFYVKTPPPGTDTPDNPGENPGEGGDEDPDPEPEPMGNVSPELKAQTLALLDLDGVGYPALESTSRKVLQALSLDPEATDEQVKEAINKFFAEKDIILPKTKAHYRITNVDADGNKIYLAYADGAVTLTRNPQQAYSFIATAQDNGTTVFYTTDGHYLHSLMNTNIYSGTSKKNVTTTLTEVNMLKLEKFEMKDVPAVNVFGMVSIYGLAGYRASGVEVPIYTHSLINTEDMEVDMDNESLHFSKTMSSAFLVEQVERPTYDAKYTLTPANGKQVEYLDTITVSFPDITEVEYMSSETVTLTGKDGTSFTPEKVICVNAERNTYKLVFSKLPRGVFELNIPEGTFTYQGTLIQAITATYKVTVGFDFVYDFFTANQLSVPPYDDVEDYQITNYYLTMYNKHMVCAPVKVGIYSYIRGTKVSEGFFGDEQDEYVDERVYDEATEKWVTNKVLVSCTYRFIPLISIKPGSLEDGSYVYEVPAGTFGDENYGKYLQDPNSVPKSACHVNDEIRLYVYVTNGVTKVEAIEVGGESDAPMYDLSGRKITDSQKRGIYIRNGKKILNK